MTNPNHTDTSRSGDLVERLRGDWPEILVEKHWMMDSDAIDKQRAEAADRIEALEAENERLRETEARIVTAIRATMCDCSGKFIADAIEQGEYRNG